MFKAFPADREQSIEVRIQHLREKFSAAGNKFLLAASEFGTFC
jgi:hypothetical protein